MRTAYQYFEDETVTLDGSDYTRAVFRRCNLHYTGSEVHLEGAMFIDCNFGATGVGVFFADLQKAIFASYYAQGVRTIDIDEDGNWSTE